MKKLSVFLILFLFTAACEKGSSGPSFFPFKTGQAVDDSIATGDDGDLSAGQAWPEPRFKDHGDGTLTDRLTGLMWEKSPADTAANLATAFSNVEALTTGSYSDWRLPNCHELNSIVNYGEALPGTWLNSQGFDEMQSGSYWTSTKNGSRAMAFDLFPDRSYGMDFDLDTSEYYYIAVRGTSSKVYATGQTTTGTTPGVDDIVMGRTVDSRFVDNGDGTITDNLTGLMWVQAPPATAMIWTSAITYANDCTTGGHEDWRLANVNELFSLLYFDGTDHYTRLNTAGFNGLVNDWWWSSTQTNPTGTNQVVCIASSVWNQVLDPQGFVYYNSSDPTTPIDTTRTFMIVRGGK